MTNPVVMRMDEYNQITDFKYAIYKGYQDNELILAEKVFQYELKYKLINTHILKIEVEQK